MIFFELKHFLGIQNLILTCFGICNNFEGGSI